MSKFKEICSAYHQAQQQFRAFQQESIKFAEELWHRMIDYFEIPPAQTTLYEISEQGAFEVANPPFPNFLRLRDDGFWEFGLGVTVYENKDAYPRDTILLYMLVRKDLADSYQVKLGGNQENFIIHWGNDAEFQHFFDYLFQQIMESYKTGLERLLQEQTTNRIGFDIDELAKTPRKKQQQEEAEPAT
jgi:hypothetical protein